MRLFGRFNKLPREALLLQRTLRRDQKKCFGEFGFFLSSNQLYFCQKKGPPQSQLNKNWPEWIAPNLNEIFFFQLAKVSCIFLTLFFSPVSGFGQTRSICCRICQKKHFHNWYFLKCLSKIASQCPWRQKSSLQQYNRYRAGISHIPFLSSIRPELETCWCWLCSHSVFHLPSEMPNKAMMLPLEVYFLTLEEQQCSPRPLSVVWWGCGWSVAGEIQKSIWGLWDIELSWNLFCFLLKESPGNHLSDGLVLSYWSSITLLQKLFWEGQLCFVGDVSFMSSLLACFELHFPEMTDSAALLLFHSIPPTLLCLLLMKYFPKLLFPTGLCLANDFNQKFSCGLSRYKVSPQSGFTHTKYHKIHIPDEPLANILL